MRKFAIFQTFGFHVIISLVIILLNLLPDNHSPLKSLCAEVCLYVVGILLLQRIEKMLYPSLGGKPLHTLSAQEKQSYTAPYLGVMLIALTTILLQAEWGVTNLIVYLPLLWLSAIAYYQYVTLLYEKGQVAKYKIYNDNAMFN